MTIDRFNEVVKEILNNSEQVLVKKQAEYNLGEDRFDSFKHGAGITGWSPEKVLLGYMTKHITSIIDMINSGERFSRERYLEKVGDNINYLILLMGLLEDRNMFLEDKQGSELKGKK